MRESVCVRERERVCVCERERETECVCERERGGHFDRWRDRKKRIGR